MMKLQGLDKADFIGSDLAISLKTAVLSTSSKYPPIDLSSNTEIQLQYRTEMGSTTNQTDQSATTGFLERTRTLFFSPIAGGSCGHLPL